jgi:hypothetical protein
VILSPLLRLDDGARTYAGYPLCRPLPDGGWRWLIERARLAPAVLGWLAEAVRVTRAEPTDDEVEARFSRPLAAVAGDARLGQDVRAGARRALARLERGAWRPAFVLSHDDLWKGNVLRWPARPWWRATPPAFPFALIDWRGARARGHAFVDLLRIADSLRVSAATLERERRRHAWLLGCDDVDAEGYALASVGELGADLGCFSPERWVAAATELWGRVRGGRAA